MTLDVSVKPAREAPLLPFLWRVPWHGKDLLGLFTDIGERAQGRIVRLDFKLFRPYLLTDPDHIQHVLRGNADNYVRDSFFFRPVFRFLPGGILGESEGDWEFSRRSMIPMFSVRNVQFMTERLIELVNQGLDFADGPARAGETVHVRRLMSSVVNRAVVGLLFGDRIPDEESERLNAAADDIIRGMVARMFSPFLPNWMPRLGDKSFTEGVRTFDEIMQPLVHDKDIVEGQADLLSLLLGTPQQDGGTPPDSWLRDNYVGMYAAGTETTANALTWLWPVIADNPDVHAKLKAEVEEVLGGGPMKPEHVRKLPYTRAVIDELMRWNPVSSLFTRRAVKEDVIDGVRIPEGSDVIISPWLTHRSPLFWDKPEVFDPERFTPGAPPHHRYAFFPFGGGPHQCIGKELFLTEAIIVVASMLSRFELVKVDPSHDIPPLMGATIRPAVDIFAELRPRQ